MDTTLAAFRLLELIALLFPVVALLLQLQHWAVTSPDLAAIGLKFGMGLLALLSVSFLLLSLHLVTAESLPSLVSVPLLAVSFIGLLLPLLAVLASEQSTDEVRRGCYTLLDAAHSAWFRTAGTARRTVSEEETDDDPTGDDKTNS